MESCERKILRERGELPNEEGDAVREYKAVHEETFLSDWMREDGRGKEERKAKVDKNEEERGEKRKREKEKEENNTGRVQRGRDGLFSVEAFELFSQGRDLEGWWGGLSWETSWRSMTTCLIVSLILVCLCVCACGA